MAADSIPAWRAGPGLAAAVLSVFLAAAPVGAAEDGLAQWREEFPGTDFSRRSIDLATIVSDGPRRDSIPPIDDPRFVTAAGADGIGPFEPVVSVVIGGDARAYPLRVLLWHEIVNDTVGGVPIVVTYCPLCNSAVVFDRRVGGRVLEFGNTGRIRHYDMVMYDRQTESWWQQFLGEAIVGELTDTRLRMLPARIESLARFRERAAEGRLLAPGDPDARPYGLTPYVKYDTPGSRVRMPYSLPPGLAPLARVVVVGDEAWSLDLLRRQRRVSKGDLVITWEPGKNSIHDARVIAFGRDVGNVVARRRTDRGLEDVVYDVSFAFAFRAFHPAGVFHVD